MTQTKNAFWRCLYTPGHDAALVVPLADGWLRRPHLIENCAGTT